MIKFLQSNATACLSTWKRFQRTGLGKQGHKCGWRDTYQSIFRVVVINSCKIQFLQSAKNKIFRFSLRRYTCEYLIHKYLVKILDSLTYFQYKLGNSWRDCFLPTIQQIFLPLVPQEHYTILPTYESICIVNDNHPTYCNSVWYVCNIKNSSDVHPNEYLFHEVHPKRAHYLRMVITTWIVE